MANDTLKDGERVLREAVVTTRFEKIEVPITDAEQTGGRRILARFSAVGGVADAVYQSGRVIPSAIQKPAIDAVIESGRQMTMFIGHPNEAKVPAFLQHVGDIEELAAVVDQLSYNEETKETRLDSISILDTPKGRTLLNLVEGGVQMGISQRAIGREELTKVTVNGEEFKIPVVKEIKGIFGFDFVHLPDANAGERTEVVRLSDSQMHAINSAAAESAADSEKEVNVEDWGVDPTETLTDEELDQFAPIKDLAAEPNSSQQDPAWEMAVWERLKEKDYATWDDNGTLRYGRVTEVYEGEVVPDSDVRGSENNPALRIQIYEQNEEGGWMSTDKFAVVLNSDAGKVKLGQIDSAGRPQGDLITDPPVPVHNPSRADVNRPWNPTTAEINKLPNNAFAWIDPQFGKEGGHNDRRKGRKLPHHLPDGRTVFRGVRAAIAILNGARGGAAIKRSDRRGVYNHLAAHYRQFGLEVPPLVPEEELNAKARARLFDDTESSRENEMKTDKNTETGVEDKNVDNPENTDQQLVDNSSDEGSKSEEVKLAEANKVLADSLKKGFDKILANRDAVNDSFTARMVQEDVRSSLIDRMFLAARSALQEIDDIMDGDMEDTVKNDRLLKMGQEMKQFFSGLSDQLVQAFTVSADETGNTAEIEGSAQSDSAAGSEENSEEVNDSASESDSEENETSNDEENTESDNSEEAESGQDASTASDEGSSTNDDAHSNSSEEDSTGELDYIPPQKGESQVSDSNVKDTSEQVSATENLVDSFNQLLAAGEEAAQKNQRLEDNKAYAAEAVKRLNLDDSIANPVLETLNNSINDSTSHSGIEALLENTIKAVNAGRSKEQLEAMGYSKNNGEGKTVITDVNPVSPFGDGNDNLSGVRLIADSLTATRKFNLTHKDSKAVPTEVSDLMDKFDSHFAADLRREKAILDNIKEGLPEGATLFDAAEQADFETPATISRVILFEVYAADIIRQVTQFGTMVNDRDQIPITRWRREEGGSTAVSAKPSAFQRLRLKNGELSPFERGKLVTEFFPIDAKARRLGATMSDEFLTRARRRPDITGLAIATQNMVDDVRRSLMQDIFFEHVRGAAANGSSTFDVTKNGDGVAAAYRILGTTDADATTIVPQDYNESNKTPILVELGNTSGDRTEVPEYGSSNVGGGPGAAFFYVIDHQSAIVTFVDANGAAAPAPSSTDNIRVTGSKADKELRYDMTLPGGKTQQQHMLDLLFEISNRRALLEAGGISANGFYDADLLLTSNVNAEFLKQATAYQQDGRRAGYTADRPISEGNYGVTAALSHWGSKNFPDDFLVISARDMVQFHQYEPLNLRGPIEARNSSGQLIGGKEWYSYQEDSISAPLEEKATLVTLYRS